MLKNLCLTLWIAAGITISGCTTTPPAAQPQGATTQAVYGVFGMDCPGCHGGLEKNLRKIDGVVDASANWSKKTVTITMREGTPVDPAEIEKAIKDSNFSLEGPAK